MAKKDSKKNINESLVTFGMLSDAMDTLLNGMQGMFDDLNTKLDKRFNKVETDMKYVHDSLKKEIDELKFDSPTRKEFNDLRDRFDRHYPTA